jgi:hypothetical protein
MSTTLMETKINPRKTTCDDVGRVGTMPPRRAAVLSGRPTCLIYRVDKWWVLELDRISAWTEGAVLPGVFHTFRALPLAISFAENRGLDYRIIHPKPLFVNRRRKYIARLRPTCADHANPYSTH